MADRSLPNWKVFVEQFGTQFSGAAALAISLVKPQSPRKHQQGYDYETHR
jgi:hypothetical protein